jgi:amino acid permease
MQTRFNAKHFLLIAILLLISFASNAQCAMCRAAIESEGNSEKAEAINDGIVYLMVIPYVLVGAIGYAIYRMRKNKKA